MTTHVGFGGSLLIFGLFTKTAVTVLPEILPECCRGDEGPGVMLCTVSVGSCPFVMQGGGAHPEQFPLVQQMRGSLWSFEVPAV